jgi:hypothetical protein
MMPYKRFRRHAKNGDFIQEFHPLTAVAMIGLKPCSSVVEPLQQ